MRLFSRRRAAKAARSVGCVVEAMERRVLLDGTTWPGFIPIDQQANYPTYGTNTIPDSQYQTGDAPKTSWKMEQSQLPDHTHIGASFSLQLLQPNGTFGTSGTLTLQGPCGSITVDPLDSTVSPTITPAAGFSADDVQGSYSNGNLSLNGPDNNQTDATWTITSGGDDLSGFGVTGGSADAGTGIGFKAENSFPITQDAWRGGTDGSFIIETDFPVNPHHGNYNLYFQTDDCSPDIPTSWTATPPYNPKTASYMLAPGVTPYADDGQFLTWQVPLQSGQQAVTVGIHAITPFMQAENTNRAFCFTAVSNPVASTPAGIDIIPETQQFNTNMWGNCAVQLHALVLSPHVTGELSDATMDSYIAEFDTPDWQTYQDAMIQALDCAPSQYDHDYLLAKYEDPTITAPQCKRSLSVVLTTVYTSAMDYQFVFDSAHQVLKCTTEVPQGYWGNARVTFGDGLGGTFYPWTANTPQHQQIYNPLDQESLFVSSFNPLDQGKLTITTTYGQMQGGQFFANNWPNDWYTAAFSVSQT